METIDDVGLAQLQKDLETSLVIIEEKNKVINHLIAVNQVLREDIKKLPFIKRLKLLFF